MKKTIFFTIGSIFLFFATLVFSLINSEQVISARDTSISFVRQMNASFSLAEINPFKFFGFWHWHFLPGEEFTQGPIHLTYPNIGYLPNTFVAYITQDRNLYSLITLLLGFILLLLYTLIVFDLSRRSSLQRKQNERTNLLLFGGLTSIILFTNPSFLGIIVQPDFEDCFIFISFVALWLHLSRVSFFASKALFLLAGFSYATGSSVIIFGSLIINGLQLVSSRLSPEKNLTENIYSVFRIPHSNISTLPILFGVIIYFLTRYIAFTLLSADGYEFTGANYIFRLGLKPDDTFYGGLFSTLKYLVPISSIDQIKELLSEEKLSLPVFWSVLNAFLLILEIGLISVLGTFKSIKQLSIKSNTFPNELRTVVSYFSVLSIFYIILFPQWSAVHFRHLARLFAPAIAISIGVILFQINQRMTIRRSSTLSWEVIALSWLIIVDQIRFFLTWNI